MLITLSKRTIQVCVLTAILWATIIHNAFWVLSSSVLFGLLSIALCLWAGLRLFAPDATKLVSTKRFHSRLAYRANPLPPLNFDSHWIWLPIAWLGFIVILQTIPFPAGIIRFLSPERAELAHRLWAALPELKTDFLTLSVDPGATGDALPFLLFPLIAFILGNFLTSSRSRVHGIAFFLLCLVLVEALYGLAEHLSGRNWVLWIPGKGDDAKGTFLNRDHFAATLSLFLPISIGWLYFRASDVVRDPEQDDLLPPTTWDIINSRQGLWFLAPAILLLGIIQSHSRGGFSSMAFSLGVMFIAGLRSRVARAFGALGIILALVLLVYAANSDYQLVLDRFDNLAEKEKNGRIATWRNSLEILADYPLLGIGPGNFANVYRRYEDLSMDFMPYQAHNEWLEGLLTFGFIGMLPLLVAIVVCFTKSYHIIGPMASENKPAAQSLEEVP